MSPIETIRFANGLSAAIYHDTDVERPYADDDAVHIAVLHRHYIDPAGGACGIDPDEIAAWERENAKAWFMIPLFLYDHSSTIYRTGRSNPFHCPWDSGRVGIVALKRADWGNGHESDEWLGACAESIAEAYTDWANGACYGYVLRDSFGYEIDSCWGFIGIESVQQEVAVLAAAYTKRGGNGEGTPR